MRDASVERLSYGDDENQFMELWRPEGKTAGAAVFIHGGFWRAKYDLHHADEFCAGLAEKGILVASLEYRRTGQPGGGWPGTFKDVVAGVKSASAQFAPTPIVVGHSAGGHLALRLAGEALSLKAIVALAPVADLRLAYDLNLSNGAVVEFLGGTPDTIAARYNDACPSANLSALRTVIVHGSKDEDVPIAISRKFVEARMTNPEPPRLIEIPGAGHMDLIDPDTEAGKTVLDLVVRLARE